MTMGSVDNRCGPLPGFTFEVPFMSEKRRRTMGVLACLLAAAAIEGVARGQRVNPNNTRTSTAIENVFSPVVQTAAKSTVKVRYQVGGEAPVQACLGTIIANDGYILTKASEIIGRDKITVELAKTGMLDAAIVGYNETLDLAMLKVQAKGLTAVAFADTRSPSAAAALAAATAASAPATQPDAATAPGGAAPATGRGLGGANGGSTRGGSRGRRIGPIPVVVTAPAPPEGAIRVEIGQWVATPDAAASTGADLPPKSVGVISTARRVVPRINGFLGVGLADADAGGARITEVVEKSGAANAGLKAGDVVKAIEGRPIKAGAELSAAIRTYAAGDAIRLYVQHGNESQVVRAVLGENAVETPEDRTIAIVSGEVSKRATFSPFVPISATIEAVTNDITLFEHDTILKPSDMGGPLVDLEGRVIGINIARAGRTETFALPADIVVPALERLKSGVFAPLPAKPPESP
jgi:S1-C subfamily serine protease